MIIEIPLNDLYTATAGNGRLRTINISTSRKQDILTYRAAPEISGDASYSSGYTGVNFMSFVVKLFCVIPSFLANKFSCVNIGLLSSMKEML
jgi:hypothetical protein